jgi:DNA-damage-inducible protein D
VRRANINLSGTAKKAGVQRYALFHNAGYRGLYDMGLAEIKTKKGISLKEDLLDRAGRTELAANEFRITQTDAYSDEFGRLIRRNLAGYSD